MLYNVAPLDVSTFALVTVGLAVVALLASYMPCATAKIRGAPILNRASLRARQLSKSVFQIVTNRDWRERSERPDLTVL